VRDRDNLEGSQGWRTNRWRALLVSCGNPKTGETQHDRSRSQGLFVQETPDRCLIHSCGLRRGKRTDCYVVAVWISQRELLRFRARVQVRLLVQSGDKSTRSLQCLVEVIDTEKQK